MNKFNLLNKFLILSLFIISFLNSETFAQYRSSFDNQTFLAASIQDTVSEDQQATLLGLMDQSFQSLAREGRRGRQIGGYVLLGLGAGTTIGGVATLAFGEGDDARIVGYSLLGGGALLSGLSLIPFNIRTESERIYDEFEQMPENTPREIQQKYIYWDRRFEELAHKWRRERIIGGVTSIVSGGITSYVVAHSSDSNDPNAYIWPAVGGLIGGVSSFLIESEKEREYKTYRSAKEEILGQNQRAEVHFGVVPSLQGGVLTTVQVRF